MKKHLPFTLEVSLWTLIVWFSLVLLKAAGWVFFCYGLMFAHEAAHGFTAFIFGCKVTKIKIYPFGFCAHIEGIDLLCKSRQFLLYFAGPAVHLIAGILIGVLYHADVVSLVMKDYLLQLNFNYFVFNLLPIYPLDGYRLLSVAMQHFFSFQTSMKMLQMISFFALWMFFMSGLTQTIIFNVCVLLLLAINVHHCVQLHDEILDHQIRNRLDRCIGSI